MKLLRLARPQATDNCLDLGSGAGHTAARLARHAGIVYALDPAPGMREVAQQLYGHLGNLHIIGGLGEDTGFPDATFDLVTARHTLHHHRDVSASLREIKRVLTPGGRLVIVDEITPEPQVAAWYHVLESRRDPTHVRAYLVSEWEAMIANAGLDWVVGDDRTRYHIDVAQWLERMQLPESGIAAVHEQFRQANEYARACFNLRFQEDRVVSFEMPMILILAVRPTSKGDTWTTP